MVTAAGPPDIRAAQAVAQRGKHGRLVQAPVRHGSGEDQPAPFRRQKRGRQPFGQRPGAASVRRLEQLDCHKQGVVRRARLELEGGQEAWTDTESGRWTRIEDSWVVEQRVGWCAMSRGGEPWRGLLII